MSERTRVGVRNTEDSKSERGRKNGRSENAQEGDEKFCIATTGFPSLSLSLHSSLARRHTRRIERPAQGVPCPTIRQHASRETITPDQRSMT